MRKLKRFVVDWGPWRGAREGRRGPRRAYRARLALKGGLDEFAILNVAVAGDQVGLEAVGAGGQPGAWFRRREATRVTGETAGLWPALERWCRNIMFFLRLPYEIFTP